MSNEIEAVAATILMLLRQINLSSPGSPKLAALHQETLKIFLRGFIDKFWLDKLCVSRACDAEARKDGLGDIRTKEPRQIPTILRKKYHLEHYLPVSDLRKQLLAIQDPNAEKVIAIISTASIKKVWLLKDEDRRLPRFNRVNPAEAYKAAGIDILL